MVRYPDIRIRTESPNPLALVAAVREAMRRAGLDRAEIHRFSSEAMASEDAGSIRQVCAEWAGVESG